MGRLARTDEHDAYKGDADAEARRRHLVRKTIMEDSVVPADVEGEAEELGVGEEGKAGEEPLPKPVARLAKQATRRKVMLSMTEMFRVQPD